MKDEIGAPQTAARVYQKIRRWAHGRNKPLHQMVKLSDSRKESPMIPGDWEGNYLSATATAEHGIKLSKDVGRLVAKLNKVSR
ncbi:MAG: hypothetical protein ACREQI_02305 [Candidatus Binataceae bacterium]